MPPHHDSPIAPPARPPLVIGHWSLVIPALALTLLLGLSLFPPSTTRLQAWPWAAFAFALWLVPPLVVIARLALGSPHARLGGFLDVGLALLAAASIASTALSPVSGAILPQLLPTLAALATPYALLPLLSDNDARAARRAVSFLTAAVLFASLLLWLDPASGFSGWHSRNAQPFGHANMTGSFALLATCWFAVEAARTSARERALNIAGAFLAILVLLASASRGAVLALGAAGFIAATFFFLRRGRVLLFLALSLLIAGAALLSNERLRELVFEGRWSAAARESNDQRTAMIVGGLRLGAERPLFGWGPGSVPHVFPRVRSDLPGTADNVLQLHNTPAQLWATLGAPGLLAAALLGLGILLGLRRAPWTPTQITLAASLGGAAVLLLFDHPFDTPVIAALAASLLALFATHFPAPPKNKSNLLGYFSSSRSNHLSAAMLTLAVLTAAFFSARDLGARAAYAVALDAAGQGDTGEHLDHLRRAAALAPDDPYYQHLLAARVAVGHPFPGPFEGSPATAIAILRRSLLANPDLEYAHYNLGWLLLASDPAAAEQHFLRSLQLAPSRGAVYLGLGLARLNQDNTDGAVRAFAAEWLLNPATAWSPIWWQPPLAPLRKDIHALASSTALSVQRLDPWENLSAPAEPGPAYRRVRTGYGVLMGHPDGPPPPDFNILSQPQLPDDLRARLPAFGWFSGKQLLEFIAQAPR